MCRRPLHEVAASSIESMRVEVFSERAFSEAQVLQFRFGCAILPVAQLFSRARHRVARASQGRLDAASLPLTFPRGASQNFGG
jgi:hypothetical protein